MDLQFKPLEIKNYVLIYTEKYPSDGKVLLVLKDKPEFLKGRLNLIGGKIEENETPQYAAVRELKEETGYLNIAEPEKVGILEGRGFVVHCFKIQIIGDDAPNPQEGETEFVSWYSWELVKENPTLMPNLKVMIPLIRSGVKDWVVIDNEDSLLSGEHHKLQVSIRK